MNDLTIVQHNDLIGSSYRLDIDEMRLLNLALTKIDSRNKNIGKIEIYPNEFKEMFGITHTNVWRNMKKSILDLMKKPIKAKFIDKDGKEKVELIAWLDGASYYAEQSDGSKIEIEFSRKIEPYLFELQGNFTKVNFEYASRLNTSFSFRLYQWLVREHRIKPKSHYQLTMTVEEIKLNAQLNSSYSVWYDFKKKVINPAIEAINQKTNLSVSYTVIKKGNKIHALTFTYIDEMEKAISAEINGEIFSFSEKKPIRPRLLRRPKVKKGSHEEGVWQKANFGKLSLYQDQLKAWDSSARLTIPDLKKLIEYSRLFGIKTHEIAIKELVKRQSK